jgi:predicted transcriptional regulator
MHARYYGRRRRMIMVSMLDLPSEMTQRVDDLARATGQSREDVSREAVSEYLAQRTEEESRIAEARAAVERGDFVTAEAVHEEDSALLTRLRIPPEVVAIIDQEVRREIEAQHGITLCE